MKKSICSVLEKIQKTQNNIHFGQSLTDIQQRRKGQCPTAAKAK